MQNIGLLQGNLVEISSVLDQKGALSDLQVVYKNRVFKKSYSAGIIGFIDRFFGEPQSPQVVRNVLKYTFQDLFDQAVLQGYFAHHKHIADMLKQIDKAAKMPVNEEIRNGQKQRLRDYTHSAIGDNEKLKSDEEYNKLNKYFEEECDKDLLTESKINEFRVLVTTCNQATREFWRNALNQKTRMNLAPIEEWLSNSKLIENKSLNKALRRAQCLTDLEGIVGQKIPIVELAKMCSQDGLTKSETTVVEKWIAKINVNKDIITLKNFVGAIKEIVSVINIQGQYPVRFDDFMLKLDEMNCELLQMEDNDHMQWRESLKEGDSFYCNNQYLLLGKELGAEKVVDDKYRVFALQGNMENYVVKIARNRLQLKFDAARVEKLQWGIQSVQIVKNLGNDPEKPISGLDRKGICVVLEKLEKPLKDIVWTSNSAKLSKADEMKAHVIANLVYCMQQWKAVPDHLDFKSLMFDVNGVLKSIKILQKGPFNYNSLEEFCRLASLGCIHVLDYLMHVSKLVDHPIADFYRKAVLFTLQTGNNNLLMLPQPTKYRDLIYERHVEELCKQAQSIRQDTFKAVRDQLRRKGMHHFKNDSDLEQEVSSRLMKFYKDLSTPGHIPPTFQKLIIDSFLNENEGEITQNPTVLNYYKRAFERMMKFNTSAIEAIQ
ncbi:MAG: hypothetical protein H0W88_09650 [Parachlamydiaceae bacterium]|nr:hypothetical protein [Parachlamydiaceae bacterium]